MVSRPKRRAALVLALLLFISICSCKKKELVYARPMASAHTSPAPVVEVSPAPAEKSATVMVYIIGSDLEALSGFASSDISEMLSADTGDNLNVIIQTGGTTKWRNPDISAERTQIHAVKDGRLELVREYGSNQDMTSSYTLSSFIRFAAENYPADNYKLILWDHGGGTISGFGYDEYHADGALSVVDLQYALEDGGVHFDFVGFDACLMGTVEIAYALSPYADYLIASAEAEPGCGWYYTDWLTMLGDDPAIDDVKLGTRIVDDYIDKCSAEGFYAESTLAVIDLSRISDVCSALAEYMSVADTALDNMRYQAISSARANAKYYGGGEFDQVDIVDLVSRSMVPGTSNLISAIDRAVCYKGTTGWSADCCGLAMYFPYDYIDYYSDVSFDLKTIGMSGEYTDFFDHFINIMAGGQIHLPGMSSPFSYGSAEDTENSYMEYDWYDPDVSSAYSDYYADTDLNELRLADKGDYYALQLADSEWNDVTGAVLQVMLDDGEGYIDLGSDNVCVFDDDGDLMVDFDYMWVAVNGQTAPFYAEYEYYESDSDWLTYGSIPALLNGEEVVELIACWSDEEPDGVIAGYRIVSDDVSPTGKGLFSLCEGDTIDLLCYYYTYGGEYDDIYLFGDTINVSLSPLEVSYDYVAYDTCLVCVMLTDIYHNNFWTETVVLTLQG